MGKAGLRFSRGGLKSITSTQIKKFFSGAVLVFSLGAIQAPLWRPSVTRVITPAGGTTRIDYQGELEKAVIFQAQTATLSVSSPGRLLIHGEAPGTTRLLIHCKDGKSTIYEVVVVPS